MPDNLYVGNFSKGLTTNPLAFNIENDAFPFLYNFYVWRQRVKKKRGTQLLGQLQMQEQSVTNAAPPLAWQIGQIATLSGAGASPANTNLIASPITGITQATSAVVTITNAPFRLGQVVIFSGVVGMTQINGLAGTITAINYGASTMTVNINSTAFTAYSSAGTVALANFLGITPGTLQLSDGTNTYTDANKDGTVQGVPGGSGTINYATGAITITGGVANAKLIGKFSYYPGIPVMGLEDYIPVGASTQYPLLLSFDTTYAYQINNAASPPFFYDVSYYKGTNNPVKWDGQDYQQFWSTNYSNAFWATNNVPGLNIVQGTYSSGSGTANITFNFKSGGVNFTRLVVGDSLWFNEWAAGGVTINGVAGTVSDATGAASGNYVVTFSGSQTVSSTGIGQLLTCQIMGQDGIRWYDGDMTGGSGIPISTSTGWVNFSPPLTETTAVIDNLTTGLYYLVGALAVLPFKDRLLFFSPWIQTSSGSPIQLQDTVLWSWNGTPYYNSLVPSGETFSRTAYYVDQTGKGGYLPAGIDQAIKTVTYNEDVLLVGFTNKQTKFAYTSDDLNPFLFFSINSEFGSESTFSGITVDRGGYAFGTYGITLTSQTSSQRIDLPIPDSVFRLQPLNQGAQRVNAVRDFFNEWIYFTYPVNNIEWKYPTQSLMYNYRDDTWAVLYENYTTQGLYRSSTGFVWADCIIGNPKGRAPWSAWTDSWASGNQTALFPSVVGGTPQGYVLVKAIGVEEAPSGSIQAISNNGGFTQITSTNHCVLAENPNTTRGDYLYFTGALGNTSATVTGITKAAQAVITATNTFTAGQVVYISGVVGMTEINGLYVTIVSATGSNFTISLNTTDFTAYTSGGTAVNSPLGNQIGQIEKIVDANNFVVDIPFVSQTYVGNGKFSRLNQPYLQTRQFPVYWDKGKQVRIVTQKYLFERTANGQVQVAIFLSQDADNPYTEPEVNPPPNSLEYSQIVYTCPESTNLGLTPANTNLQMPTAATQSQIWHRYNTSLIGDTFQIGLTLSDEQMRQYQYNTSEITLHGMHFVVSPSSMLA